MTEFEDRQRWSRGLFMSYFSFYGMLISLGVQVNYLRKLKKDPSIGTQIWKKSVLLNLGASSLFLYSMMK